MKENLIVRYNWVDDGSFFEFRITRDELTGDVSLLITDFAEPTSCLSLVRCGILSGFIEACCGS
jgi:hypothetical protein